MVMELQEPACAGTEPRDTQNAIRIYTIGIHIPTDPLWQGSLKNVQSASIPLQ